MHAPWLAIGEFARLGGVSIKALRLYAELGLLPPAAVNAQSHYRLYTPSQLPRLHRILVLKHAGFTLAEIRRQLSSHDRLALPQIRARLLDRAEEIQRQLSWIDAAMLDSEMLDTEIRPTPQVVIKRVPKLAVWSRRQPIDSYDQADVLLRELARGAPGRSRLVSGAIWHDCGQRSGRIDCEVFWLSHGSARAAAPAELASATVASILHEGGDSTISATYEAIHRWLRDHRHHMAGPNRELYLCASLTEIQFPIN